MEHTAAVDRQFSAQASAYLTSQVHAHGRELARLGELAARVAQGEAVLDLGCGAGHASFAMAPHAREVMAYDLSADMLKVVAAAAAERSLGNISTQRGPVEKLAFPDATFALVASRYSAHHWSNAPAALCEARRVLKPGGILCMIDVVGPQGPHAPLLDTHLQAMELLRDTSHLRDYSRAEWHAMLDDAGFTRVEETDWRLDIHFADWLARMRTPPVLEAALRHLLAQAPDEFTRYYAMDPQTLDFRFESAMFVARATGESR